MGKTLLIVASAVAVLLFALAVDVTGRRVMNRYHVPESRSTAEFGLCDFHNAVYYPAKAFLAGVNPYGEAYVDAYPVNRQLPPYSPGILLFHAPWALLPLEMSDKLYFLTNVALTLVLASVCVQWAGVRATVLTVCLVGTFLVLSRPGQSNLVLGQVTLPMVLAAIWALRPPLPRTQENYWFTGAALSVAMLKPTFGLPLAVLLLAQGRVRPVVVAGVLSVLLAAIPLALFASGGSGEAGLGESVLTAADAHATDEYVDPETAWMRIDLPGAANKLAGINLASTGELVAMLVVLAPCCAVLAWRRWKTAAGQSEDSGGMLHTLAILTAVLASIYHLAYDLLLLAPSLFALLGSLRNGQRDAPLWLRCVLIGLVGFLFANYLTTWSFFAATGLTGTAQDAVILLNPLALLLILLLTFTWLLSPSVAAPDRTPASR